MPGMKRMRRFTFFVRLLALAVFVAAGGDVLCAQGSLRVEIQLGKERVKALTSLSDTERQEIDALYAQALEAADRLDEANERAETFRKAMVQFEERRALALANLDKARQDTSENLQTSKKAFKSRDEVTAAIARIRGELADAEKQAAALRTEIEQITIRQSSLPELLRQARQALTKTNDETAPIAGDQRSELDRARALLARANAEAARAAAEALSVEQTSQDARMILLEIALQEKAAQIKALKAKLTMMEGIEAEMTAGEVTSAESLLERAMETVADGEPQVSESARELAQLTNLLRDLTTQNTAASEVLRQMESRRSYLEDALSEVRALADVAGASGGFAEVVFSHLMQIGVSNLGGQEQSEIMPKLAHARAQLFDVTQRVRRFEAGELRQPREGVNASSAKKGDLDDELRKKTASLLREAESSALKLVQTLAQAEATSAQARHLAKEFRELATQKLFWVRSAPPLDAKSLLGVPEALKNILGAMNLRAALSSVNRWALGGAILLLVLRLVTRRRLLDYVAQTNQKIRRVSSDRYALTLMALGATVLASLPVPLALLLLGLGLPEHQVEASPIMPKYLFVVASLVFHVAFLANVIRSNGIAEGHFGWRQEVLVALRSAILIFAVILLPAKFLLTAALFYFSGEMLGGVGRLGLIIIVVGMGALFAWLLRPGGGLSASGAAGAGAKAEKPVHSRFWPVLVVVVALVLLGLLLSGYVMTVWLLVSRLEASLLAAFWAIIAYGLAIRLFAIRERRLKIDSALQERKARREAARSADEDDATPQAEEELADVFEAETAPDITEVCRQTRNLIGFLVSAGLLGVLWFLWTQFAPVVKVLEERELVSGLSVADMGLIVLVVAVAVAVVRNLPGLLEALIFHRLKLDSGSRTAFITLGQYAVFGLAAVVLFGQIGVDWAKFAWLAAALSVGIGFGLQEVVANFISGIILLFERPIRVGDVVTVDNIDGVVSRIQIRATTITGWDRKEYVVPNKNFITGTVLNWTLSNPVNRIVINIGVAYGSDTELARQILLETAREHPNILSDPAPIACFEEFGESALKLSLRAYLPDLDNRLSTMTSLNTEIARRFAEAGIEIAFPQLDVHLKKSE